MKDSDKLEYEEQLDELLTTVERKNQELFILNRQVEWLMNRYERATAEGLALRKQVKELKDDFRERAIGCEKGGCLCNVH